MKNDIIGRLVKKKTLSDSLRILIPLFTTYIIFVLSVFLIFIPQQKQQLLDQKKQTILQLTDNALSLLSEYESKIQQGEISEQDARKKAINHIRNLRYGPEGKDYFWINDMHPTMIMHPYRADLEGRDLTHFKDPVGNYLFVTMVEAVKKSESGYVDYYWQWKDVPEKIVPKISYVKGFTPWRWIIGTGMYLDDVHIEIERITQKFIQIFMGILFFIVVLSLYLTIQIFKMGRNKELAEKAKKFEELRLKKLFELSQMTQESIRDLTEFALEEAIFLTESKIGYLAFLNEDESQLTMHTWSKQAMKQCEIEDKILIYNVKDTGLWAEAARNGETQIVNDYENFVSPAKKGIPHGHVPISRVINIPVFDQGKMVALAGVGNKKTDYNNSDVRQLQLMMDGMWKILQRKKTEDDLRRSEQRYRLLADNATDGIWVVQLADLKFSYVSPSMETITGYPAESHINKDVGSNMTEESFKEVVKIISEELARDSDVGVDKDRFRILEVEMVRRNNKKIWAEVTARFLRDENGVPEKILGITRDISQRKALEQELQESNTDLRLAQRISGVGNWSINPKTGIRIWSEEVYRIYERDPKLGPCSFEELEQIYKGKWWKIFYSALQDAMKHGIPFDLEFKLVLPSGKVKWINGICEPDSVKTDDGYFIRGTVQDITERKNLETRVQQAQKMEALGTLAGGIAHDFNNILSSIIGFTELSRLGLKDNDDDLKNNLDQVLTAGIRARDLVKHILTFSRKADAQTSRINIVPLVKECLQFLKASIPHDIEIKKNFSKADFTIIADSTQLHQVFMNLLTNAAYAMKEGGGVLGVTLKSISFLENDTLQSKELNPGRYVQITVSDTGCGIPKELIEKVFEPFFTTKIRGEGTGMGLSMVYGIIKEMEGHISVYSEPDMGTTFEILIPEQVTDSGKEISTDSKRLRRGKGRILLVDDETAITSWTSQVLLKLGYETIEFNSATEALERFKQNPSGFDLILTDLAMPKMTGLMLANQIKNICPDIPIIVCTGFSEGLNKNTIGNYGIDDIIMKPLIASELAQAVGKVLSDKPN